MLTFNTDGMVAQRFPFPTPIMDYILNNLQPRHMLKLYKTCKFFYAKLGIDFIQNLVIAGDDEEESFDLSTTVIRASNPALAKLKDFWITDSLICLQRFNVGFIPSFTHCTIKKLEARDPILWSEYETLTKAGTIEELKIGKVYRDGELVPVEELIALVPNATSIELTESCITDTSAVSLAALDYQGKISNFTLKNIGCSFFLVTLQISKFLRMHAAADCKLHFDLILWDGIQNGENDVILGLNEQLKELSISLTDIIAMILKAKENFSLEY